MTLSALSQPLSLAFHQLTNQNQKSGRNVAESWSTDPTDELGLDLAQGRTLQQNL